FPKVFKKIISDETINIITGVLTLIYLLVILWPTIMKYRYIFFSADIKGVTLRWYSTGLMQGDSMSIEIPAERYAGFEITSKFFGMYTYLTLFQNVQNQKAGYNPVSITALSGKQKRKLEESLNNYRSTI
ncbi:MAG: hypothetical protein IH593_08165, partial [Bacteroidales bacterium]|nr:hypothetical protein [Bacteroidales bacterium]